METVTEFLSDKRNEPVWDGQSAKFDRMHTQIGEHHWRDGLTFRRVPDVVSSDGTVMQGGSVRIRQWFKTAEGHWEYRDVAYVPPNEWESIVREVATPPASAP